MTTPPADWYPDPTGRFDYRYWDGQQWTEHVSAGGQTQTDPLEAAPTTASGTDSTATGAAPADTGREPAATGDASPTTGEEPDGPGPMPADEQTPATVGAPAASRDGADSTVRPRPRLLDDDLRETASGERVGLENDNVLKVVLGDDVLVRRGAEIAVRGEIELDHDDAGGRGEHVPLVRCSGTGELFLAHDADDVHLVWLDGDGVIVNGRSLLAHEPALESGIEEMTGATPPSGGLVTVTLRGSGWVAVATHGTPVALTVDQPTSVHRDAVVAWSDGLDTSIGRSVAGGPEEPAHVTFSGRGVVIVQG